MRLKLPNPPKAIQLNGRIYSLVPRFDEDSYLIHYHPRPLAATEVRPDLPVDYLPRALCGKKYWMSITSVKKRISCRACAEKLGIDPVEIPVVRRVG